MSRIEIVHAEAIDFLRTLPDASVDALVTDPPSGISFMGADWDSHTSYDPKTNTGKDAVRFMSALNLEDWEVGFVAFIADVMTECWRVLKPGAHGLVWALPRTSDLTAMGLRLARFQIRDSVHHMFGSGFPKSMDISKAIDKQHGRMNSSVTVLKEELRKLFDASGKTRSQIDKECGFRACNYLSVPEDGKQPDPWFNVLPSPEKWETMKRVLGRESETEMDGELDEFFAEAEREIVGYRKAVPGVAFTSEGPSEIPVTAPATPEAQRWEGWGTALKPGHEVWWLVRKPLSGTVAQNVQEHGVGGIHIDACRVATHETPEQIYNGHTGPIGGSGAYGGTNKTVEVTGHSGGRWPPNVLLTHSAGCELVGTKRVKKGGGVGKSSMEHPCRDGFLEWANDEGFRTSHYDKDGLETIQDWHCEEGCPVDELARQSGQLMSGSRKAGSHELMGYRDRSSRRCLF